MTTSSRLQQLVGEHTFFLPRRTGSVYLLLVLLVLQALQAWLLERNVVKASTSSLHQTLQHSSMMLPRARIAAERPVAEVEVDRSLLYRTAYCGTDVDIYDATLCAYTAYTAAACHVALRTGAHQARWPCRRWFRAHGTRHMLACVILCCTSCSAVCPDTACRSCMQQQTHLTT